MSNATVVRRTSPRYELYGCWRADTGLIQFVFPTTGLSTDEKIDLPASTNAQLLLMELAELASSPSIELILDAVKDPARKLSSPCSGLVVASAMFGMRYKGGILPRCGAAIEQLYGEHLYARQKYAS